MGLFSHKKPTNGAMCLEKIMLFWDGHSNSTITETVIDYIRKGAEEFDNSDCQFYLGRLYIEGVLNKKREYGLAIHWFKKAASKDHYIACTYLTVLYLTGGHDVEIDYREALTWIDNAGINIRGAICKALGDSYLSGVMFYDLLQTLDSEKIDVKVDHLDAKKWYLKAVEYGNKEAIERVAYTYYKGKDGINKDFEAAINWCEKAIECLPGSVEARILSARIYAQGGFGITRDIQKALDYCKDEKGLDQSIVAGEIYQYHTDPPNYEKALMCYTTASRNDRFKIEAIEKIGWMYLKGLGVNKSYKLAKSFLIFEASSESSQKMYYEGYFAHYGLDTTVDYNLAHKYYNSLRKEDLHYGRAVNQIGILYHQGLGVKKDYATAIKYFELAAKLGCKEAYNSLGDVFKYGFGGEVDYNKALKWYIKASKDCDDNNGHYNLGMMYFEGKGTDVDYELALHWLQMAQKLGNELVQPWLIDHIKSLISSMKQSQQTSENLLEENLLLKTKLSEAERSIESLTLRVKQYEENEHNFKSKAQLPQAIKESHPKKFFHL